MSEENGASKSEKLSNPQTWVDVHGDFLFGYAILRLKDTSTAEDAVQETFLAALNARDSFRGQSGERTWLVSILKNKIIDHFRRLSREVDFHNNDIDVIDDDFIASGPRAGTWKASQRPSEWVVDAADLAEQKEFWEYLRKCIDRMPPHIGMVFILRDIENMKNEDICNVLTVQPTNLRVILHRARKRLRRCLEKIWLNTERSER